MYNIRIILWLFTLVLAYMCRQWPSNRIFGTTNLALPNRALIFRVDGFENETPKNQFRFHCIYNENGYVRESLSFGHIPKRVGIFALNPLQDSISVIWRYITDEGGILNGKMITDTSKNANQIEILEANKEFTRVKGKFRATIVFTQANRYGDSGIRIPLSGSFDVKR